MLGSTLHQWPLFLAAMFLPFSAVWGSSRSLRFAENKGQWPQFVRYECAIPGGHIFLENNTFTFYVFHADDLRQLHPLRNQSLVLRGHAWKQHFVGARPSPTCTAQDRSSWYLNYFIGNDPSRWATEVYTFGQVTYSHLYEGIDLKVYAHGPHLKYDFIVQPMVDPSVIAIEYEGIDRLELKRSVLQIHTSVGTFTEQKPFAYQWIDGKQVAVRCSYVVRGNRLTFSLGGYDRSQPLIIDPTLIFASYTGSTADNFGYTATYDASGAMYLGGLVHSAGYPVTTGAVQINFGGGNNSTGNAYACDYGIMKLSAMGNALLWATYLGGSNNETPHSMVTDADGNLIIYGRTWSTNFPVTSNAFDPTHNGNCDIVVSKISSNGTQLLGSTYLGGSLNDGVNYDPTEPGKGNLKVNYGDDGRGEVVVDADKNIYVATCTSSPNFPVTSGAFQTNLGGQQDGVIFKLNPDCSVLLWSTFIGGSADDACYSMDLRNNEVYACGGTMSVNFPVTPGVLHGQFQGGTMDGFVVRLNSSGSALLASTFIGTDKDDQVYFVKLDKDFDVYLFGQTYGAYPIVNAVYANPNSGQFIHKLDGNLSTTVYSTVFGNGNGAPNISPTAFAVDTCENIYLSGWGGMVYSGWPWFSTNMLNMPVTADAVQPTTDGTDFYIAVFRKNMSQLAYATYYGGYGPQDVAPEHVDGGTSRFDPNGNIYQAICAGCGGTSLTPATPGAWSETNQSFNCNQLGLKFNVNLFVVEAALQANPTATGCVPLTVTFSNFSKNASQYTWHFGDGNTSNLMAPTYTYTDTGTFHVMLIAYDPQACKPYDTAYTTVVVYNTVVEADFSYSITDYCDSMQVVATAFSPAANTTFTWHFGNGITQYGPTAQHTFLEPGLYEVQLIAYNPDACTPLDTFSFTVDFTNVVIASLAETIYYGCPPLTIPFQNIGFGGVSFFWDFGDGNYSTDPKPVYTYTAPGTYHGMFIAYDPNACRPSDTVLFTVVVYDYPPLVSFLASPKVIVDYNSEVTFTNTSQGAVSYLWEFGDGTTSTETHPTHTYTVSGTYLACLTAYNAYGCPAKTCEIIQVDLIPIVDVPNAFSPNGDGVNDILYVRGQDVLTLDFRVFNRWGELVFQTNNLSQGWDGLYKGVPQEMDVYAWMLSARFSNNKSVTKSGNVTLLR